MERCSAPAADGSGQGPAGEDKGTEKHKALSEDGPGRHDMRRRRARLGRYARPAVVNFATAKEPMLPATVPG